MHVVVIRWASEELLLGGWVQQLRHQLSDALAMLLGVVGLLLCPDTTSRQGMRTNA